MAERAKKQSPCHDSPWITEKLPKRGKRNRQTVRRADEMSVGVAVRGRDNPITLHTEVIIRLRG